MEARKIAIACFIGGMVCYALAALFAPQYAWLGIFSGFAAGYLSYEFREVLCAIPVAFREAERAIGSVCWSGWRIVDRWTASSHPFTYAVLLATAGVMHFLLPPLFYSRNSPAVFNAMFAILVSIVIASFLCFFFMSIAGIGKEGDSKAVVDLLVLKNVDSISYGDAACWFCQGIVDIVIFVIGCVVAVTCVLPLMFAWKLFTLIHSDKRLLCAVDGTLGGMASFILCHSPDLVFHEHALATVFGGLIGAVLGVLNWEFISVRILKVSASMPKL